MGSNKKPQEEWKAYNVREERKQRLEQMKDKEGGKKPIKTYSKVGRIFSLIVAIAILLSAGYYMADRYGVIQGHTTALKIGSVSITPLEVNFHMASKFSEMTQGLKISERGENSKRVKDFLAQPNQNEAGKTNKDYLLNFAAEQIQQINMLADQAKKENFEMTEKSKKQIEDIYENLRQQAERDGKTLNSFLADTFGKGATEKSVKPIIEKILYSADFENFKRENLEYSEAQLNEYYEANKDALEKASYRDYSFATAPQDDAALATGAPQEGVEVEQQEPTEEEIQQAKAAAKQKADEMLAKIVDEESYKEAFIAEMPEEQREDFKKGDYSLAKRSYIEINGRPKQEDADNNAIAEWLFAAERKAGDKAVIEAPDSYHVVYFQDKGKDEEKTVSVRHILIGVGDNMSQESLDDAQAKEKAENILKEYQDGEQSEEHFSKLAMENSDDPGSASMGGIYKSVAKGRMVKEFEDWSFGERKTGDVEIVKTQFGYHIMYFVKENQENWQEDCKARLQEEEMKKYVDELKEQYPFEYKGFGKHYLAV